MSCLFIALAPAVGMHYTALRQTIVNYLSTNPILLDDNRANDIIGWTENIPLQQYLTQMSQNNSWGGAIEIRAYCDIFSVNVCVHVLYTNSQFSIETSKTAKKNVHIQYNGSHFEPMYTIII